MGDGVDFWIVVAEHRLDAAIRRNGVDGVRRSRQIDDGAVVTCAAVLR